MTVTIDFETMPIVGNPIVTAPKPVGVAIKYDGEPSAYYTGELMASGLYRAFDSGEPLIFHNAPFDLSVATQHFDIDWPAWDRVHDTMYLIFLNDPHTKSLSLKKSGEALLGIKPDKQTALKDWILHNVPQATARSWGKWMYKAPHEILAPYACQDTDLTYALWEKLHGKVPQEAYDRERRLMPHLVKATKIGIRIDREQLAVDLEIAEESKRLAIDRVRDRLNAPMLDLNKGHDVAEALKAAGVMDEDIWPRTKKSNVLSTAKDALLIALKDKELLALLNYVSAMTTVVGTFMGPWLEKSADDGRLHPNWNQVRTGHGGAKTQGTRTGRMSSDNPNFQNIPKPFDTEVPEGLTQIPSMRDYCLPEEGHVWVSRDFASQEMRILAQYEQDSALAPMKGAKGEEYRHKAEFAESHTPLLDGFKDSPDMDPHAMIGEMITAKTGKVLERKHVKGIGFGLMYGMGVPGLAKQLGVGLKEAQGMVDAYTTALPGINRVKSVTAQAGLAGRYITTWGGRKYTVEPSSNGKSYEYKLTNYLIQGSAADQTKEALIRYCEKMPSTQVMLAVVHDEINISMPIGGTDDALRLAMEEDLPGMDVPMRTTREIGKTWGNCK